MSQAPEDQQQQQQQHQQHSAADRSSPIRRSSPLDEPLNLNLNVNLNRSNNHDRDRLTSADEMTLNSLVGAGASWDDSFDAASDVGGGGGGRPSSSTSMRPSSRASKNDRRKQFDTTTPTLIDEEDDEETLQKLRAAAVAQRTASVSATATATAASGGASTSSTSHSLYKSTLFQPTADEAAIIAGLRQRSSTSDSFKQQSQTQTQTTSDDSKGSAADQSRMIAWEQYSHRASSPQSTASAATPTQTTVSPPHHQNPPQGPFSFAGPWGADRAGSSASARAQANVTAASVNAANANASNTNTTGTTIAAGAASANTRGSSGTTGEARTHSGAFSPSILRLTEDIGNLLHEDDPEDDYAFDIPNVFRGGNNNTNTQGDGNSINNNNSAVAATAAPPPDGSTTTTTGIVAPSSASASNNNINTKNTTNTTGNFDWTGSFVHDTTENRTRRVPSRTSLAAVKAGSRRREQFRQHQQLQQPQQQQQQPQQQQPNSGFVPYTQQPKPRRNEVFEFGKLPGSSQQQQQQNPSFQQRQQTTSASSRTTPSEERASPQLLSFGGAFAPPAAGAGVFSRPVASFQDSSTFSITQQGGGGFNSDSALPLSPQQVAPPPQLGVPSFHGYQHHQPPPHETNRPRFSSLPSSDQLPPPNLGARGLLEHAQSFDSYQSGTNQDVGMVPTPYFQQYQLPSYPPGFVFQGQPAAPTPTFGQQQQQQQQQQQDQQLSDMQATAQVFVPQEQHQRQWHSIPTGAPGPPSHEDQQQQQQQHFGPPSVVPQGGGGDWHSTRGGGSSSYGYGYEGQPNMPNFPYAVQSPLNFDPRGNTTPTPTVQQSWRQLPSSPPPIMSQQHQQPPLHSPPPPMVEQAPVFGGSVPASPQPQPAQQQQVRSESASSATPQTQQYAKASSPHPSLSSSEQSGTQRGGSKQKDTTKRKPRGGGKKKTGKVEQQQSPQPQQPPTQTATTTGPKKGIPILPAAPPARKKSGGSYRPGSTTYNQDDIEDLQGSATEEGAADPRRTELVESPSTRIAFKEFYRAFRGEERISFQRAEEFALSALEDETLPESVHWRVYLELADLAKRSNRYAEARVLYEKVCQLQPYASQGWLEYSKLEEECGRMNRVMNILYKGLDYCQYSENLLNRAIKHQEKLGKPENARGILARLKHVGIEKVWRTVLEGALLEARAGNIATARRVLKYLMHHVPWYGPLYLEAYRLEKDQGHTVDALLVVERGLRAIPRYGPLWFGAFRLCEQIDVSKKQYHLPSTMEMIERAASNISRELVWKVHLDAAQMLERAALEQASIEEPAFDGLLVPARLRYATTILTCPNNLRWKVWLAAARMELGAGDPGRARALFQRAHQVVPKKGRSSTLLECARLEDFSGKTDIARAILCKGRALYGSDWKVWLESVALEIRCGDVARAVQLCDTALGTHYGTGRLWATLVQLRHYQGRDEAQLATLKRALTAVPKSGEVWCEGGRVHLNPFSDTFDLDRARRHLHFATRFTPQYGDGFVETIRLELVEQWLAPIASYIWDNTKHSFLNRRGGASDAEGVLITYITDVALAISVARQKAPEQGTPPKHLPKMAHFDIVAHVRKHLQPESLRSSTDLNGVRLSCINADPNYGVLWFHCRRKMTDSPRCIIEDAAEAIAEELQSYAHLYLAAMIRRKAVLSTIPVKEPPEANLALETSSTSVIQWEDYVDKQLHAAPSLVHMFNPTDPTTGMVLLENTVSGPLFATGLTEINRHQPIQHMSLTNRKRVLFGNEALFP